MNDKPIISGKGRYHLKYRGTECLNCGHPLDLSDRYCPNCSQANSTKKISLKDYVDEFFGTLIAYDARLFRTLSTLLIRPGKITRNYIDGKRISFTNPFRFLLSLAIIYFLMINFTGNFSKLDKYAVQDFSAVEDVISELTIDPANEEEVVLSQKIDSLKKAVNYDTYKERKRKRDSLLLLDPGAHLKKIDQGLLGDRFSAKHVLFTTLLKHDTIYDYQDIEQKYGFAETFENKMAFNIANGFLKLQKSPGSFLSTLISKLPFVVFFFLPVFTLFIWLVYIRKKYSYTDHLIFSFHNTALLFILLIISYLIDSVFKTNSNWIFLMIFSTYLFAAMRNFYGQSIFKTIVKYLFLNTIFFILAIFSTVILFTGNIITF
ncbi:DUF3667 domain-containing protein [Zobellia galactanivorans]|uniref:DUF3667 domain-containing protein n=1 Tax=Zobellia galactanivorans (strain DSM 12802 / CCUG 47099 / CIP 106680 / NCIMB 13871 / Dsij) TaxID=63186 RepID=UPI0026E421E7|nr:DUF3667 domain-containing protein [Zobellia galactanivorans]MDO6809516.1 DUF3667 domain-containing protein [Zobellia galactanivorans]